MYLLKANLHDMQLHTTTLLQDMQVLLCCHLFQLPLSLSFVRLGELVSKMSFNGKEARLAYPTYSPSREHGVLNLSRV